MPHAPLPRPDNADSRTEPWGIRAPHLLAAMVALIGIDNLLLLRFLGVAAAALWIAASIALAIILVAILRIRDDARIPPRRLLLCLALGIGIVVLGGEGRLFYANADWIVRYTLLADMARWPWPFAYAGIGTGPTILRAPIGMYLLPALAGKLGGASAMDWALPGQNGLMLGALLALGSTLFATARTRRIALAVILMFSGMDTLGEMLVNPDGLLPFINHIDGWANDLQYSANITLAFWVPQHAMIGWLGALLFLLWRAGRLPLSCFLAIVPVTMIWSPLGVMGTLPFAAHAGIETLLRKRWTPADIALPLVALVLAAAPIAYLQANAGKVGFHPSRPNLALYVVFVLLEAAPFLAAAWFGNRAGRIGRGPFALVAACLLLFPFLRVGTGADFVMRASITPLAILAVLVADVAAAGPSRRIAGWLFAILAIGALTPAREILRAVMLDPAPTPACDMPTTWDRSFPQFGKETYLAPAASLPTPLRPAGIALESPLIAGHCWSEPWAMPRHHR
jgi:hypothetical protein